METKHRKGEWYDTDTLLSSHERGVRTSAGYICFLPKPNHYTGQDERYEKEMNEYKANAKLIAAAPDLLEALIELREFCHYHGYDNSTEIYAAEASIKKATE